MNLHPRSIIQIPAIPNIVPQRLPVPKAKPTALRMHLVRVHAVRRPWFEYVAREDEVLPRVSCVQPPPATGSPPTAHLSDLAVLVNSPPSHLPVIVDRHAHCPCGFRGLGRQRESALFHGFPCRRSKNRDGILSADSFADLEFKIEIVYACHVCGPTVVNRMLFRIDVLGLVASKHGWPQTFVLISAMSSAGMACWLGTVGCLGLRFPSHPGLLP